MSQEIEINNITEQEEEFVQEVLDNVPQEEILDNEEQTEEQKDEVIIDEDDQKLMDEIVDEETIQPSVNETIDQPAHYNNDVYRDCKCTDDELRYQMIQDKVDRNITNPDDMEKHLYNFCDENLETRYRHVMGKNQVLPMETTKKTISLKLKKKSEKERAKIADTISETFGTYYPEKILTFINSTVTLLFIERMKDMKREFTCVHQGTYYKIVMTSEYHKVRFGRSYTMVDINILTSKFE